jgi:hypothetical protein
METMQYAARKIVKNNGEFKLSLPPFWIRSHQLEHGTVIISVEEDRLIITPEVR